MISENWTRENLAWLAGLFEGEGNVSVREQSHKGRAPVPQYLIGLSSTDEDVIRRAITIAGVGRLYGPYATGFKPIWHWKIGVRHHAMAFLFAIFPWLGSRRKGAVRRAAHMYRPSTWISGACQLGHMDWYTNPKTSVRRCRVCYNITTQQRKGLQHGS